MTPAERMRRMRLRRKEAGLKPVVTWAAAELKPVVRATKDDASLSHEVGLSEGAAVPSFSFHRVLDARSLAMHAVIAQKIDRDPKLLDVARRNLLRWRDRWADSPPAWWEEWREILSQPWPTIAAVITDLSERATRLRQSSPFAGVLTPIERKRIYEAFRA